MFSRHRLFSRVLSSLITASAVLTLAGPIRAQDDVTPACPNGLRTVEDPISEAPNLACTNLYGVSLYRADLTETDLTGANLSYSNLVEADLTGADLTAANLTNSLLDGAVLSNADLSRANLTETMLENASLREADLSGAKLSYASLVGADLSRAQNLSTADLRRAYYSSATQFPPGFDPAAAGMTFVSELRLEERGRE